MFTKLLYATSCIIIILKLISHTVAVGDRLITLDGERNHIIYTIHIGDSVRILATTNQCYWTFPTSIDGPEQVNNVIKVTSQNQIVSISLFTLREAGEYTCALPNGVIHSIILNARGSGIYVKDNTNIKSIQNNTVQLLSSDNNLVLLCLASSLLHRASWITPTTLNNINDNTTSTTTNGGVLQYMNSPSIGEYRLEISSTVVSMDQLLGVYACIVMDSGWIVNRHTVIVYPAIFSYVHYNGTRVILSQDINNRITAEYSKPSYILCPINRILQNTYSSTDSNRVEASEGLIKVKALTSSEATYSCRGRVAWTVNITAIGSGIIEESATDSKYVSNSSIITLYDNNNNNHRLFCTGEYDTIHWRRDSGDINNHPRLIVKSIEDVRGLTLDISAATREEQGVYYCSIRYQDQHVKHYVRLFYDEYMTVYTPVPIRVYTGEVLTVSVQPVNISCTIPLSDIQYATDTINWVLPVTANVLYDAGGIQIPEFNVTEHGIYRCIEAQTRSEVSVSIRLQLDDLGILVETDDVTLYTQQNDSIINIPVGTVQVYVRCIAGIEVIDWIIHYKGPEVYIEEDSVTLSIVDSRMQGAYTCIGNNQSITVIISTTGVAIVEKRGAAYAIIQNTSSLVINSTNSSIHCLSSVLPSMRIQSSEWKLQPLIGYSYTSPINIAVYNNTVWTIDSTPDAVLHTTLGLSIRSIGRYYCSASNENNQIMTSYIDLYNTNPAPASIQITTINDTIMEELALSPGLEIDIYCKVLEGQPPPQLLWVNYNSSILHNTAALHIDANTIYLYTNATAVNITCRADNIYSQAIATIQITLLYWQSEIIATTTTAAATTTLSYTAPYNAMQVRVGTELTLNCNATYGVLTTPNSIVSSLFTTVDSAGLYHCTGVGHYTTVLQVNITGTIILLLNSSPDELANNSYVVSGNHPIEVLCLGSNANNPPNWASAALGGYSILDNSSIRQERYGVSGSLLRIVNLTADDAAEGQYICRVYDSNNTLIVRSVWIYALTPVSITLTIHSDNNNTNLNATHLLTTGVPYSILTCTANGYPSVYNAEWTDSTGRMLSKQERPAPNVLDTAYTPRYGVYVCTASNIRQIVSRVFSVTVLWEIPAITLSYTELYSNTVIYRSYMNSTNTILLPVTTTDIQITCNITDAIWNISASDIVQDSTIAISPLLRTGLYTCISPHHTYTTISLLIHATGIGVYASDSTGISTLTDGQLYNITRDVYHCVGSNSVWYYIKYNDTSNVEQQNTVIGNNTISRQDIAAYGEGFYACVAGDSNNNRDILSIGLYYSVPYLDVKILLYNTSQLIVPSLIIHPANTPVIQCNGTGYPIPTLYWHLLGQHYNSTVLHTARITASGRYFCVAKNSIDTEAVYVDIALYRATPTLHLQYDTINSSISGTVIIPAGTTDISIVCNITQPIWSTPTTPHLSVSSSSILIEVMTPSEVGEYMCHGALHTNVSIRLRATGVGIYKAENSRTIRDSYYVANRGDEIFGCVGSHPTLSSSWIVPTTSTTTPINLNTTSTTTTTNKNNYSLERGKTGANHTAWLRLHGILQIEGNYQCIAYDEHAMMHTVTLGLYRSKPYGPIIQYNISGYLWQQDEYRLAPGDTHYLEVLCSVSSYPSPYSVRWFDTTGTSVEEDSLLSIHVTSRVRYTCNATSLYGHASRSIIFTPAPEASHHIATSVSLIIITIASLILLIIIMILTYITFKYYRATQHIRDAEKLPKEDPQYLEYKKLIPLALFEKHLDGLLADEKQRFIDEYALLRSRESDRQLLAKYSRDVGRLQANMHKNRYKDTVPYDRYRIIILAGIKPKANTYINASIIKALPINEEFIAAQGPKDNTQTDFWQMIWERKIRTIIMLTSNESQQDSEMDYFPNETGESRTYGDIAVINVKSTHSHFYSLRILEVLQTGYSRHNTLRLKHFHFTSWPDNDTPTHACSVLEFIRAVKSVKYTERNRMVVHCKAGVGRTGTFICLYALSEQIKKGQAISVFKLVDTMRHYRPIMVQTQSQYEFIHLLAMDMILGDTYISSANLQDIVLRTHHTSNTLTCNNILGRLRDQHRILAKYCPVMDLQTTCTSAALPEHNRLNPCTDRYPFDRTLVRIYCNTWNGPDYINASHMDTLNNITAICAQHPNYITVQSFIHMIKKYCPNIVIILTSSAELNSLSGDQDDNITIYWPAPGLSIDIGQFTITNNKTVALSSDIQHMEITIRDNADSTILCYHTLLCTDISTDNNNIKEDILTELIMRTRDLSNYIHINNIIFHCRDGSTISGLFLTIYLCLLQYDTQNSVSVYQTAKLLRGSRYGVINSEDQYRLCFRLLYECSHLNIRSPEY